MLTGHTKVLAVFGCPVEHSLSPAMHNAAIEALGLDYIYVPFRVKPEELAEAVKGIRSMGFAGVNLTIPLKEVAVGLVDGISSQAKRIGSVNTLWWKDEALMGDSTDGEGFMRSLEDEAGRVPKSALILGAGGSARAISYVLSDADVQLTIANRSVDKAQRIVSELEGKGATAIGLNEVDLKTAARSVDLIVNCTSVGMTPNVGETPLPAACIEDRHIVYDLVYNPQRTRLLDDANARGARAINGLKMLAYQGAFSFKLWTGIFPPVDIMEKALKAAI